MFENIESQKTMRMAGDKAIMTENKAMKKTLYQPRTEVKQIITTTCVRLNHSRQERPYLAIKALEIAQNKYNRLQADFITH